MTVVTQVRTDLRRSPHLFVAAATVGSIGTALSALVPLWPPDIAVPAGHAVVASIIVLTSVFISTYDLDSAPGAIGLAAAMGGRTVLLALTALPLPFVHAAALSFPAGALVGGIAIAVSGATLMTSWGTLLRRALGAIAAPWALTVIALVSALGTQSGPARRFVALVIPPVDLADAATSGMTLIAFAFAHAAFLGCATLLLPNPRGR